MIWFYVSLSFTAGLVAGYLLFADRKQEQRIRSLVDADWFADEELDSTYNRRS